MKAFARNVLVVLTTTAALAAANAQAGSLPATHLSGLDKAVPSAASAPKLTAAERARIEALTHETRTLMAHAGIAPIAIDANMRDTASAHTDAAQKIADRLAAETAQVNAGLPLLTAKVTERSRLGDRNYWLPLENDTFTFRDIDAAMARRHVPGIVEVDVQPVRMLMARELGAQKNYANARRTLQYAQRELKAFETDTAKADPDVVTHQAEINTLDKDLEAKDPSAFSYAAADIERWLAQVEGWLKSHGA